MFTRYHETVRTSIGEIRKHGKIFVVISTDNIVIIMDNKRRLVRLSEL